MKQYVVDAFTKNIFCGNQAAVCILENEIAEKTMQNIACENNFSETAFAIKENEGYRLRWFTPGGEVNLCSHATLATAFVLFEFYEKQAQDILFHTLSGELAASKKNDFLVMDFPAYNCKETAVTQEMSLAMGKKPKAAYIDRDLLLVYEDEKTVRELSPDFERTKILDGMGVAVTAKGEYYDCVSRFFAPKLKINEDPVTGSAHCMIAPYWAKELGKSAISCYQASQRGGELLCEVRSGRVLIYGNAVLYCESQLNL